MKKEVKTFKGGFIGYERLKNSRYGNPRYRIYIYNKDTLKIMETYANSSIAYEVMNYYKKDIIVKYHVLKNGKNIIDDIRVIL